MEGCHVRDTSSRNKQQQAAAAGLGWFSSHWTVIAWITRSVRRTPNGPIQVADGKSDLV
jgi:hypothetical protein